MEKKHSKVLSSLVLSGAVMVMAPQAFSQTGGSAGSDRPTSGSSGMHSGSSSQSSTQGASSRMSKENVKQVQAALKSKGMDPGPEDGVLGAKTQQAIREFQKSNNLSVTGRIDDKTASALGVDVASSGSGMGSSRGTSATSPSSGMSGSGSPSAGAGKGTGSVGDTGTKAGSGKRTGAAPDGSPAGKAELGEGNPK
jgi:peptidoglycan hydrolase-like protein with peptidoglycan-binding domain